MLDYNYYGNVKSIHPSGVNSFQSNGDGAFKVMPAQHRSSHLLNFENSFETGN